MPQELSVSLSLSLSFPLSGVTVHSCPTRTGSQLCVWFCLANKCHQEFHQVPLCGYPRKSWLRLLIAKLLPSEPHGHRMLKSVPKLVQTIINCYPYALPYTQPTYLNTTATQYLSTQCVLALLFANVIDTYKSYNNPRDPRRWMLRVPLSMCDCMIFCDVRSESWQCNDYTLTLLPIVVQS